MIGRRLAHYEILAELGRGGMGVVYKARDTRLGRLVALKLLPEQLAEDPRRIDLLRREAQAAAALSHPRIVTVYSVEEADGRLFLTMEYVDGKTLDRAIPRGGFSLDRFFRIAIPLADAVSTAHDRGIVHRDLKPGNVILSKDDRPKILDFGLARLRPEELPGPPTADTQASTQLETLEGKLAGTVPYMSPEQLNRRPIDHRTDIFSLGVIYYEMATGRHPFGSRPGSVASSILEDEPDSVADVRSGLPRQLGRIIRRCLQKEADNRIQSAKDLRNELEDLSLELAQPAAGAVRPARPRLRRWALPAALVATILVAAGAILFHERLTGVPAPPAAIHLAVEESRIFPGDRGPDYFRQGVITSLRWRVRGLSGVYLAQGERHPLPDYVVEADVRRSGDNFSLSYRLKAREEESGPASAVHHAAVEALFPLVDTVWQEIGRTLRSRVDRPVRYRQAGVPTTDATAYDLFLRAEAALATGGEAAHREALTLLEEALARDRRFGLALATSGRIRLLQHRVRADPALLRRAETACREAAALDSTLAEAHACLGDARLAQGRALDAAESYREAIRLDPSDLRPHTGLRLAYLDLGLPESLEASWKELIRLHPDHWAGYASLGGFYQDQDRYEPALEQYLLAIERAPQHARLHFMLGSVYYLLGRYEDATQSNQRSMAIRPNWYATYNLGSLHYVFRRFDEAVAAYEQAVAFRPDHYASHGRLGWACYWAPGRRAEAADHLARAVELTRAELERTPEDADLHVMLAVFEAIRGDRDGSLEALTRALYYQPNSGHHLFLAAVAQTHRGDLEAAIGYLQQAVAQGYPIAEIRHLADFDPLREDPRFTALLLRPAAGPGSPAAAPPARRASHITRILPNKV